MGRLCVCREYEGMFTEGFKYVESLEKHDEKVRAEAEEDAENRMSRILDDEKRLAYEQGRADQKEEDNAFFNFEGAWELEKKKFRADAINEFIKGCKATHDGLICNWDKPYGITFERMEEKAKEYEL